MKKEQIGTFTKDYAILPTDEYWKEVEKNQALAAQRKHKEFLDKVKEEADYAKVKLLEGLQKENRGFAEVQVKNPRSVKKALKPWAKAYGYKIHDDHVYAPRMVYIHPKRFRCESCLPSGIANEGAGIIGAVLTTIGIAAAFNGNPLPLIIITTINVLYWGRLIWIATKRKVG